MPSHPSHPLRFHATPDMRLFDMFDGALPPDPPDPLPDDPHDFLVMCLRPDATLPTRAPVSQTWSF